MLKATGIVRPVDQLGRVVLPKSLRRMLGLDPNTDVEIYVDGESIVLQKYLPGCVFCGDHDGLTLFKEKLVCPACTESIKQAATPHLHV